ncbi:hypothetical protein AOQ84DRAFT_223310, partial [Glonium stellatum]
MYHVIQLMRQITCITQLQPRIRGLAGLARLAVRLVSGSSLAVLSLAVLSLARPVAGPLGRRTANHCSPLLWPVHSLAALPSIRQPLRPTRLSPAAAVPHAASVTQLHPSPPRAHHTQLRLASLTHSLTHSLPPSSLPP